MVVTFGALWTNNRRLEAIFLGLISIPNLFNIWLRELTGRPRPTADLVDVLIGYAEFKAPVFPAAMLSTSFCSMASLCT
jgi:hypothetical protein